MSELYNLGTLIKRRGDAEFNKVRAEGLEPNEATDRIADAQLDSYTRLTDPAIRYDNLSQGEQQDRQVWLKEIGTGINNGDYQLVTTVPTTQRGMVESPQLSGLVAAAVEDRNANNGVAYGTLRIVADKGQTEAARYDRAGDTLFVSNDQLTNPDMKAIGTAMDARYDRNPETLRAELKESAAYYFKDSFEPDYDRAAARVQTQAGKEGWASDEPRVAAAKADAALPYYTAATDPANPAATKAERDKLLANTENISALNDPAVTALVQRGTASLNAENGQAYPPPQVLLVKGLANDNGDTPARFDMASDTVQVDADYYATKPAGLDGVIGHELGHRYQRSPEEMKLKLEGRYDLKGLSDDQYKAARALETEADTVGANIAGPAVMKEGLNTAYAWSAENAQKNASDRIQVVSTAVPEAQDKFHPTQGERNAYLDSLMAKEGLSRGSLAPQEAGANGMPPAGPISSPANAVPQKESALGA